MALLLFSQEGSEPPHVHIEQDDKVAKFWLDPVELAGSDGFRSHELSKLRWLVIQNRLEFLERWNEHFASPN